MEPDEVSEEEAVDLFIDENLAPDEQEYLMDAIEVDPKLSEIFDRVMLKAIEVTKEGAISGPGDGDDDAIPARLSDGEFVFSAPAVQVIGLDKLEAMHNEAVEKSETGMPMENQDPEQVNENIIMALEQRLQKLEGGYIDINHKLNT